MNNPAVCFAFALFWLVLGIGVTVTGAGPTIVGLLALLTALGFGIAAIVQLANGNNDDDSHSS